MIPSSQTRALADEEIDRALRDLFSSTPQPRARNGFDRRLERTLAAAVESASRTRRLRLVMWCYWIATTASSLAILWYLGERLAPGPGLWISLGGLAILTGAALALSILGTLPSRIGRWARSPGR
jgi:hypothetical protein